MAVLRDSIAAKSNERHWVKSGWDGSLNNNRRVRFDLRAKWLLAYAVMVMIVAATMALGLYFQLRQNQRAALQERLLDIVSFAVPLVDGDFHALIRLPGDVQSSFYRVVSSRLVRIQETSRIIRRIYTLRQEEDGAYVYVVGANSVTPIEIGSPYLQESEVLSRGMEEITGPIAETELSTDEEGAYLRGFAPIYDRVGQLDGVLAIEIDA